jgi:hypothetical protein
MHILLENIMKELLAIWEGKYKASMITGTPDGRLGSAAGEDYVISKNDWDQMDKDVSASNRTIPSQMARRMESLTKRSYWTAESYSYLLIHLGPIILKGRLGARYYQHYVKLSHLSKLLTKIELTVEEVDTIKRGLVAWVREFEQ